MTILKTFGGCFLVLRKLLLVSFCVVVWVLFSVFSIFCITSLVSATPRNHPFGRPTFSSLWNDSVLHVYLDIFEPSLSSLPGYVFLTIIYPMFRSPDDNENVNGAFLAGYGRFPFNKNSCRSLKFWITCQ